jgi:hypothetical protein
MITSEGGMVRVFSTRCFPCCGNSERYAEFKLCTVFGPYASDVVFAASQPEANVAHTGGLGSAIPLFPDGISIARAPSLIPIRFLHDFAETPDSRYQPNPTTARQIYSLGTGVCVRS